MNNEKKMDFLTTVTLMLLYAKLLLKEHFEDFEIIKIFMNYFNYPKFNENFISVKYVFLLEMLIISNG